MQDAYAIKFKDYGLYYLSANQYLFFASVISKSILKSFEWANKANWERVKKCYIKLPIQNHKIDFNFMETIVAELETQRVTKFTAYLKTTGLDNYELTEEEKKILDDKNKDIIFKPFKLGKSYVLRKSLYNVSDKGLFNVRPTNKKINANTISFGKGNPYVARGEENNGIRGLIESDEKYLNQGNTISFGQDTATIYYQKQKYFTGDKILVLELNEKYGKLNEKIALYLIGAMKKTFALYGWGQGSYAIDSISSLNVYLPVSKNNKPDFDYMEKYIKAVQKLVIKNVVEYKDKLIDKTRGIISKR